MRSITPQDFLDVPEMKMTAAAKLLVYGCGDANMFTRLLVNHRRHIRNLIESKPLVADQGGMVITDTSHLYIVDSITPARRRCDICVDTEFEGIHRQHLNDLGIP